MDKLMDVRCKNDEIVKVSKDFLSLCANIKKKRGEIQLKDMPAPILVEFYAIHQKLKAKDFDPFKHQPKNINLIHSNPAALFNKEECEILDELWQNGKFTDILKHLEVLHWDNLSHAMAIYYSCKIRNVDKQFVLDNFNIEPKQFDMIEMKVIDKLISSNQDGVN